MQDIQDEGAGSEQGRHKDREVDEGKQEDKESGKEANFYFRGLTPFLSFLSWVCEQCGEVYFEEKEVDAIQDLIKSLEQKAQAL
jgi:hypothetical protein